MAEIGPASNQTMAAAAEDFNVWLEEKLFEQIPSDAKLLIVSMVGKEVADNTKADLLNSYLGKEAFLDRWICNQEDIDPGDFEEVVQSAISIDVYFDSDESVLWLLLNGTNDVSIQHLLFNRDLGGKSFFEKMASVECLQLQALAQLFQLSHAILFVDQGCRFDLDLIGTFKQLNRVRPKICKRIRQTLSTTTEEEMEQKWSKTFTDTGRLASPPRLLFCFYRNPLRSDLGTVKKKELLEKMEKCLEAQIANLLKSHGLTDNRFPDNGLAQITIASGAPFVYCFNNSETPGDINHDLAMALFGPMGTGFGGGQHQRMGMAGSEDGSSSCGGGSEGGPADLAQIIEDIEHPQRQQDREKLDPSDYNFNYFLHKALNNLRNQNASGRGTGKHSMEVDLPSIGQFVRAASIVQRCVGEEFGATADGLTTSKVLPELNTVESLVDSAIRTAESIYTRQLALQPEVTGGGDPVFSSVEHEYTMKMALDYLDKCCPRAAGTQRRDQMAEKLRQLCNNCWQDGHRRCERRSLTGQLCHFEINHDTSTTAASSRDRSDSRGRKQQKATGKNVPGQKHSSGVKTFSMCNCGLSRQIRIDPFTLKEANFDFYAETDNFSFGVCCAQLDRYEFKCFDPASAAPARESPPSQPPMPESVYTNPSVFEATPRRPNQTPKDPSAAASSAAADLHFEEELNAGLAIDPSEFNVRFFDDNAHNDAENEEDDGVSQRRRRRRREGAAAHDEHPRVGGGEFASQEEEEAEEGGGGTFSGGRDDPEEDEGEKAEEEDENEEEDGEGEERTRKRNLLPDASTEEEEDEEEEEEEEEATAGKEQDQEAEQSQQQQQQQLHSSSPILPPSSSGSPDADQLHPHHYLDEYDLHLTAESGGASGSAAIGSSASSARRGSATDKEKLQGRLSDPKFMDRFKGQFLDHVPHSCSPPALLPLFPSFAVVCLGQTGVYNHATGIRGAQGIAHFRNGSEFLLPWSVELTVNTERWVHELQYIGVNPSERTMRNLQNGMAKGRPESKEKVKLFVGFNYECPRGHQFMVGEPGKPLKHRKSVGPLKTDAAPLLQTDLPIWMPCPCRKEPRTSAQLMRIHVLTPKAPVSVLLQPRIQMPEDDGGGGCFFPGAVERIELGWAKYYVCRLPYAYVGPSGQPIYRPTGPEFRGLLMRQCVSVNYLPLSASDGGGR